jgi:glycosyltransferase involved in cell wall biosynthesis
VKILLSAASFSSGISGLQRHAFNAAHCLLQQPEITALHIVVAPWQAELLPEVGLNPDDRVFTHIAEMGQSSLNRNWWHYHKLPQLARALGVDLVHFTFPMPVNAGAFPCPTVVTLHDMYPYEIPGNFGFPKWVFNRITLRHCLRNADAIACVSDATRRRLRQYMPATVWRKATRIHNCVETCPENRIDPARSGAATSPIRRWHGQPFLLCVAQHRKNKNIPMLLHSFARLLRRGQIGSRSLLVVVGMNGPDTPRIHKTIARLGLGQRVHLLEGLTDAELQWCYAHCEVVAAPSITEGFGLPVAEALMAGGRVVCSEIPALREVGGEHCRYVPLGAGAADRFADAMAAALCEPKTAPVALPQFSKAALGDCYIELYRGLIAEFAAKRTERTTAVRTASWERPLP